MRGLYLDLFFLIHWSVDYALLYLTAVVTGFSTSALRLAIAAGAGALFAVVYFLYFLPPAAAVVLTLALPLIMLAVAFRLPTLRGLLRGVFTFWLLALMLAGAAAALVFTPVGPGNRSYWLLPTAFLIALCAAWIISRYLRRKRRLDDGIYPVVIRLMDRSIRLNALLDSGNRLRDPYSGAPVIIVERGVLTSLLPPVVMEAVDDWSRLEAVDDERWQRRIRPLACQTVGGSERLLGLEVDRVFCLAVDRWEEADEVTMAVSPRRLDGEGRFSALLSPEIEWHPSRGGSRAGSRLPLSSPSREAKIAQTAKE